MLTIGLTGGIGSGKSTVAKLFAEHGIAIIDTDQIARDITLPGQDALKKIAAHFGNNILLPDHTLDRAKLRKTIFEDPKQRQWLEQLLHPLIRTKTAELIAIAKSPYCIAVIPLLLESKPNPLVNRILVVDSSIEQQIARAKLRDQLSDSEINATIQTQVSREKRLTAADDIIYNECSLTDLIPQVEKLHQLYLSLSK
jgi:dephospho-CoA kinase